MKFNHMFKEIRRYVINPSVTTAILEKEQPTVSSSLNSGACWDTILKGFVVNESL